MTPSENTSLASKIGGLCWILATLQFAAAQLIAAFAWNPPYSWTNNYISDLGNTACGEFTVPHGARKQQRGAASARGVQYPG